MCLVSVVHPFSSELEVAEATCGFAATAAAAAAPAARNALLITFHFFSGRRC
jgi:hypothetical protein